MHGTDDPTVPFSQSVELDSLLNSAGQDVIFKPIVGAGHGGREFRSDSIRNMIVDFFDRHLKDESSTIEKGNVDPRSFELDQNFPNPFNFETKIGFEIRKTSQVILKLFNIHGEEVKTLVNEYRAPGVYEVGLGGSNLSSGIYFYQISAGNWCQGRKMILLK